MAGTFGQFYAHVIFTPQYRANVIRESSNFINDKNWVAGKFNWQKGYGYFSHSHSALDTVVKYVLNQKEHHKKKSFRKEYIEILKRCEVEYKEEYLFEWISDDPENF